MSLSELGGAAGMLQWGNVFFCVAKRTVDKAALAGEDITVEVVAAAEKDLKQAEAKYEESRRIKPNYYDAFISMGNVDFERAKLSLSFAVPPPTYASQHLTVPVNPKPDIHSAFIGTVGVRDIAAMCPGLLAMPRPYLPSRLLGPA